MQPRSQAGRYTPILLSSNYLSLGLIDPFLPSSNCPSLGSIEILQYTAIILVTVWSCRSKDPKLHCQRAKEVGVGGGAENQNLHPTGAH